MKHMSKRLSALLLALVFALTGLVAVAQEAPQPMGPEAVYARGNSIKTQTVIKVEPEALRNIMREMNMLDSQDEQSAMALNTVLSALGKITTTIVSDEKLATYAMDTEHGKLLDGAVVIDQDKSEMYITNSLLPGLKVDYPKEIVQSILNAQKQAADMQKMVQLFVPYGDAVGKYFVEEVMPKVETVEGLYSVATIGDFTSRSVLELDSGTLLGVLKAVHSVFKDDADMQAFWDNYVNTITQLQDSSPAPAAEEAQAQNTVPSGKELADALAKVIADGEAAEPVSFGTLTIYSGEDSQQYWEFESKKGEEMPSFFLSLQQKGDEQDMEAKLALVIKGMSMDEMMAASPDASPKPEAPVDWAAEQAAIMDGSSLGGVLVLVDLKGGVDQAKNQMESNIKVSMHLMNTQLGITSQGTSSLTGEYQGNGQLSLSFMSPEPLVSVSFASQEVPGAPAFTPDADLKAITLPMQEDISAEDSELLGQAVMIKGLPQLIENLKTALPEEGPMLAAMLQNLLSQAPETPN